MFVTTFELARALGREHGTDDVGHLIACPDGVEKLRDAYGMLGRAALLNGLEKSAERRAGTLVFVSENDQNGSYRDTYRDSYTAAAIACLEDVVFSNRST
jgi:hypothetical protein